MSAGAEKVQLRWPELSANATSAAVECERYWIESKTGTQVRHLEESAPRK